MNNEKLEMKREDWEYLRQYRQAPFQKRYLELLSEKELKSTIELHN
ncbi:MAG: hypothetical protein R3255_07520 [Candidatus Lokiarchaeia archaeon]|nr:hypothetical protein [Candidatus Lokiarchaeia archaeon]